MRRLLVGEDGLAAQAAEHALACEVVLSSRVKLFWHREYLLVVLRIEYRLDFLVIPTFIMTPNNLLETPANQGSIHLPLTRLSCKICKQFVAVCDNLTLDLVALAWAIA